MHDDQRGDRRRAPHVSGSARPLGRHSRSSSPRSRWPHSRRRASRRRPPPKPAVLGAACCAHAGRVDSGHRRCPTQIKEASGIAASRRVDDVWWVHNDSGDTARVFAISTHRADARRVRAVRRVGDRLGGHRGGPGSRPRGVSYLYVGDIGDNAKSRASVQVYRVPEPLVEPGVTAVDAADAVRRGDASTLQYPDGAHDAEALFVDPDHRRAVRRSPRISSVASRGCSARRPAVAGGSTTTLEQGGDGVARRAGRV